MPKHRTPLTRLASASSPGLASGSRSDDDISSPSDGTEILLASYALDRLE
jgi:hypothetical protein